MGSGLNNEGWWLKDNHLFNNADNYQLSFDFLLFTIHMFFWGWKLLKCPWFFTTILQKIQDGISVKMSRKKSISDQGWDFPFEDTKWDVQQQSCFVVNDAKTVLVHKPSVLVVSYADHLVSKSWCNFQELCLHTLYFKPKHRAKLAFSAAALKFTENFLLPFPPQSAPAQDLLEIRMTDKRWYT